MTTTDTIAARVRRVLIDSLSLNLEQQDLEYDDKLDEVVGLDSMAALEFVMGLEKEFGVTIDAENLELDLLRDLPALSAYIQSLLPES